MWIARQETVGTTPVLLFSTTDKLKEGILKNAGTVTFYIQNKPVDVVTEGFPIAAGESLDFLYLDGEVWAQTASSSTTAAWLIVEK